MDLCELFGVSKQAYYQYDEDAALRKAAREAFALQYIKDIRETIPVSEVSSSGICTSVTSRGMT